jgi:hypothetical protein
LRGGTRSAKGRSKQIVASAITGSQPFQKQFQFVIPGINRSFLSNTLSASAAVFTLDPTTDIANWASYSKVHDEFRVLSITIVISPVAITSGITMFYLDEDDSSLPTNVLAATKASNTYSNNNVACPVYRFKKYLVHGYDMHWSPASLQDMDWHDTSSAWQHIYLKAYTDNAFYSTPDETHLFVIRAYYTIAFRGVQ